MQLQIKCKIFKMNEWKLINDMTGRKSSKKGIIKGEKMKKESINVSIILEIFSVE